MKKTSLILLSGLLGSIAAFAVCYFVGTASSRELLRQPQPELAWLKQEFNLGEAEFARITQLHQAYLPQCAQRCALIEEQSGELKQLLDQSPEITPRVQELMSKRAQMRADCEAEMLKHFIEVSRTMPPEQGQRYLAWIERQTFLRGEEMEKQHHKATGSSHHH